MREVRMNAVVSESGCGDFVDAGGIESSGSESILLCMLANGFYYGLDYAVIVKKGDAFLLIVSEDKGRALFSRSYPSLRGAKLGFSGKYRNRKAFLKIKKFKKNARPEWTFFYPLEIEEFLNVVKDRGCRNGEKVLQLL